MTDQLRECPFCNGDGELDIDENHNHFVSCIECRAEGSRAACASDAANAWNTRPTAVASHAEGEVVAWRWRDDVRPGLPWKTTTDADVIDQLRAKGGYEIEPLYTHPPRSGDEAMCAARYRWLRDPYNEGERLVTRFGSDELDQAIDAAMAARGDDK